MTATFLLPIPRNDPKLDDIGDLSVLVENEVLDATDVAIVHIIDGGPIILLARIWFGWMVIMVGLPSACVRRNRGNNWLRTTSLVFSERSARNGKYYAGVHIHWPRPQAPEFHGKLAIMPDTHRISASSWTGADTILPLAILAVAGIGYFVLSRNGRPAADGAPAARRAARIGRKICTEEPMAGYGR